MANFNTKNNKRESTLVKNLKDLDCNQSLLDLHKLHSKLCLSILFKLSKRYSNWFILEELKDEIHHIIYKSAKKYKHNKNTKFSTFLANETKWAFFDKMNAITKSKEKNKLNEMINSFSDKNTNPCYGDMYEISIDYLKQFHDPRVIKIFNLRYEVGKKDSNKVMPWHEIGSIMNLSSQGCINLHGNGIKFIKEKLEQEGIINVK